MTEPKKTVTVYIMESEAGWGSKVDSSFEVENEEAARKYCIEYNDKYNLPKKETPDWYMYATYVGQKEYGMLRSK